MNSYTSFDAMATGTGALNGGGAMSVFNATEPQIAWALENIKSDIETFMSHDMPAQSADRFKTIIRKLNSVIRDVEGTQTAPTLSDMDAAESREAFGA